MSLFLSLLIHLFHAHLCVYMNMKDLSHESCQLSQSCRLWEFSRQACCFPIPPPTPHPPRSFFRCPRHLLVKLNMTISWALGHIPYHLSERESPRGWLRDAGALYPHTPLYTLPSKAPSLHCPPPFSYFPSVHMSLSFLFSSDHFYNSWTLVRAHQDEVHLVFSSCFFLCSQWHLVFLSGLSLTQQKLVAHLRGAQGRSV